MLLEQLQNLHITVRYATASGPAPTEFIPAHEYRPASARLACIKYIRSVASVVLTIPFCFQR